VTPVRCKHGLDLRSCSLCRQTVQTEALRLDALRVPQSGRPVVVLRVREDLRAVKIARLDEEPPLVEVPMESLPPSAHYRIADPYVEEFWRAVEERPR
jgi:hypothetical protein